MKSVIFTLSFLAAAEASLFDIFPRASSNCTTYTVQTGDTCAGIGKSQDVTWAQLLAWNSQINSVCSNLGSLVNTDICVSNPMGNFGLGGMATIVTTTAAIPSPTGDSTNSRCGNYYKVAKDETCTTMTDKFSISRNDLLFLNPELFQNCTNLLADTYYCVQPVGYIATYSGYGESSTPTVSFDETPSTSLPSQAPHVWPTGSSPVILLANGTRTDCNQYMWFSGVNFTENEAADCWNQAWLWNVSDEEIILWNPSLASNETSSSSAVSISATATSQTEFVRYPCTLAPSSSYCVQLATPTSRNSSATVKMPTPRANGEIANCTEWFAPKSEYDTCDSVIRGRHISFDEFYAMNPSVKSDCSGLTIGTNYCISTYAGGYPPGFPGFVPSSSSPISSIPLTTTTPTGNGVSTPSAIQTGMVSTCDQFYKVIADDGCYDIASDHDISLASFYAWNPAVKTDCSGLQANEYVCVGVKSTTTSSVVVTTASGVTTPSPIQTGMISTCDIFYDVVSGDSCYDIANDHGISLDSFYAWNPAVKTDCSGLQPNEYVCIGVKSTTGTGVATPYPIQTGMVSTCDKFYKVIADDSCVNIANAYSIPVTSFYTWNPAVKTDCSGLQANEYVCVGVYSV